MYTEEDISSAIEAGVLTKEAAVAFRAHVAQGKGGMPVDEEHFRLISGFNDIFVVIACVLVLASVAWIGTVVVSVSGGWLGAALVAIAAWFLAEFFIRKRRMALPAIVLSLAFVGGVLFSEHWLLDRLLDSRSYLFAACATAALAAWLHWLRFHIPITVALGVGAGLAGVIALFIVAIPEAQNWTAAILLIAGLIVFALALRWDATDTARQTRRSDIAFWLHLLAAPLLVHPLFTSLGVFEGQTTAGQVTVVIVLYGVLALIALGIDRRALMVSALGYVLYAFSALLKQQGVVNLNFAITGLVLGSALLLLSAFWHISRRQVLRLLPAAVWIYLPPLR